MADFVSGQLYWAPASVKQAAMTALEVLKGEISPTKQLMNHEFDELEAKWQGCRHRPVVVLPRQTAKYIPRGRPGPVVCMFGTFEGTPYDELSDVYKFFVAPFNCSSDKCSYESIQSTPVWKSKDSPDSQWVLCVELAPGADRISTDRVPTVGGQPVVLDSEAIEKLVLHIYEARANLVEAAAARSVGVLKLDFLKKMLDWHFDHRCVDKRGCDSSFMSRRRRPGSTATRKTMMSSMSMSRPPSQRSKRPLHLRNPSQLASQSRFAGKPGNGRGSSGDSIKSLTRALGNVSLAPGKENRTASSPS